MMDYPVFTVFKMDIGMISKNFINPELDGNPCGLAETVCLCGCLLISLQICDPGYNPA